MSFDAPVIGSPTPWGIADYTAIMAPGIVAVGTPSHGGIWMAPERHAALPAEIAPMNGRAWLEEDCEAWAAILAFEDVKERDEHLGSAICSLAHWYPAWLDALAPRHGLPNSPQVAKINALWERFGVKGQPDLAEFQRRPGSEDGFVEGQIGPVWFGIAPDGQAHS